MISRKSATAIGECYNAAFTHCSSSSYGGFTYSIDHGELYDFLFDNDYSAWFCNQSKRINSSKRAVKEWIMKLHTGETQKDATPNWKWEQRQQLGQEYLRNLAEDVLQTCEQGIERLVGGYMSAGTIQKIRDALTAMSRQLELDGYIYRDGRLLYSEADVLDTQEEAGVLQSLYKQLALGNEATAMHHLALSEEHYLAARWDDAISNARKFFECVLAQIAITHSLKIKNTPLAKSDAERPVVVRDYLEREGMLEAKEKEAVAKVYGLLSNTGGHPYMAKNDQARLLRHLALTLSQFAMLRFQGFIAQCQPKIGST